MQAFREFVIADLARAHRLAQTIAPDPIDPQFRIATPAGDWWIAIALDNDPSERQLQFRDLQDWFTWKGAVAFTLASELHEPPALMCAGVSAADVMIGLIPVGLSEFDPNAVKWFGRDQADPAVLDLLPGPEASVTPERVQELQRTFGPDGRWPAIAAGQDIDWARRMH